MVELPSLTSTPSVNRPGLESGVGPVPTRDSVEYSDVPTMEIEILQTIQANPNPVSPNPNTPKATHFMPPSSSQPLPLLLHTNLSPLPPPPRWITCRGGRSLGYDSESCSLFVGGSSSSLYRPDSSVGWDGEVCVVRCYCSLFPSFQEVVFGFSI